LQFLQILSACCWFPLPGNYEETHSGWGVAQR
jgi:hypothetical protein